MTKGDIAALLASIVRGEVCLVAGAREVVRYGDVLERLAPKENLVVLGFESETDDVPLGDVRKLWDPSALAVLEREVADYVKEVGDEVKRACGVMLERLASSC